MTIGFVGLGQMGKPMALNLTKPTASYIVCDRRPDEFPDFERKDIKTTINPPSLPQSEIIILSLPSTSIVDNFLLGPEGVVNDCARDDRS